MKKAILLTLAAAASLAAPAAALAQTFDLAPTYAQYHDDDRRFGHGPDDERPGGEIRDRIGFLSARIDQNQRRGLINNWQARQLRDDLNRVRWMEQRYRDRNGGFLNDWQRGQLNRRLDGVAGQLRFDRR
jgi:hypothetical protein